MCGIAAYKGRNRASKVLLDSLRRMAYRGYDSVGMAFLNNNRLIIKKGVGKVDEVNNKLHFENAKGNLGIAHTRWATNGIVTKENAHPHSDCNGKIAVVHNGIIENYEGIKEELEKKGHTFKSQTDTEVIPHLIEEYKKDLPFKEACIKAVKRLEGSYAILVISEDTDKIFGAKDGSPLIFGINGSEIFAASEISAFLEYTNNVLFLEDKEYAVIDGGVTINRLEDGRELKREMKKIEWSADQIEKGGYEHFMLKEIFDQKRSVTGSLRQNEDKIRKIAELINNSKGIFFVACGTAYHAALTSMYLFSDIAKEHVNVVLASEFHNYRDFLTKETLVVAVSQSGETADVIDAIKSAKNKGTKTFAILNVMGSSLMRLCDDAILINAGPEIAVASTKAFTGQIAVLSLLAYACAGKFDEGKKHLMEVAGLVEDVLKKENLDRIRKVAKSIKDSKDMFLIGRGLSYPLALEGALKIKEVSYIHAEGFAGGELKHGTIALIDDKTPCIVIDDKDNTNMILSNANEVKARGGLIIGISNKKHNIFDTFLGIPQISPILIAVILQLMAYYLALERGCDIDCPKNLAKVVTVR